MTIKEEIKEVHDKVDKILEISIRNDEKIKNQGRSIKFLFGLFASVFVLMTGTLIKLIIK